MLLVWLLRLGWWGFLSLSLRLLAQFLEYAVWLAPWPAGAFICMLVTASRFTVALWFDAVGIMTALLLS